MSAKGTIIGSVVGTNAAKIAIGIGAKVTIIDLNPNRLRELSDIFGSNLQTLISNPMNIAEAVKDSDLVIGSVLIPGAKAPKLVTEEMISNMERGSVIVDVAIDQGGNFETISTPTTHSNPTVIKHGVVHYAVANIPGAVPRTATVGLTNVTIPYAIQISTQGITEIVKSNPAIRSGINVMNGKVTLESVAEELGYDYITPEEASNMVSGSAISIR